MEIPDNDQHNLHNILETLSLHQELNNKCLLTLLHHEVIDKNHQQKAIQAVYEYGTLNLKQEI